MNTKNCDAIKCCDEDQNDGDDSGDDVGHNIDDDDEVIDEDDPSPPCPLAGCPLQAVCCCLPLTGAPLTIGGVWQY